MPQRKSNLSKFRCNLAMYQCYYCERIFDSKEQLYEHVEVHSDIERNEEIMERKKQKEKEQP